MNKKLFFDAGPIITLVMSRLGWTIPLLKKRFSGRFYITPAVKYELVDRPITVRRFELEALEVMKLIREGILEIYQQVPKELAKNLSTLANHSFQVNGQSIDVMQEGEMESIACALKEKAPLVVDERTIRIFIERSSRMKKLLEKRFRKKVVGNKVYMDKFSRLVKGINIIRSVELVGVAYRQGLLNSYLPSLENGKNILLEAVLWSTKYNGCAVSEHEIEEIKLLLLAN